MQFHLNVPFLLIVNGLVLGSGLIALALAHWLKHKK